MSSSEKVIDSNEILKSLKILESRVSELETIINAKSNVAYNYEDEEVPELTNPINKINMGNVFESKVGEIGLAWIGNIVLLFGIIFLVQFIRDVSTPLISIVFEYSAVAGVFILSRILKKAYSYMS